MGGNNVPNAGISLSDGVYLVVNTGYRASNIYLSVTPASGFWAGSGTRYYTRRVNGQPVWSTSEAAAVPNTDPVTTPGAAYAPMLIERFTKATGNTLKIYYLNSTWNPYTVVKMRSEFTIGRP